MANNTTLDNGDVIADEDIAGVKYQQTKLIDPTPGSVTPIGTDDNPIKTRVEGLGLLRKIFQLLKPLGMITGNGSNRLSVDINALPTLAAVTTVTTVTTVATVTTVGAVNNMAQVGGVAGFDMMKALSRSAYNTGVRAKIS